MGDITREKLNEFRKDHRRGRRFTALFLVASLMVSTAVGYGLRQTGISATADYFCGQEEHVHSEDCYAEEYICGLEAGETEPTEALHIHTQDCYEEQQVQVCGFGAHTHGEDCYTLQPGELVCGTQEHVHEEDCFDEDGNQVCDLEEHTHGESCYAPGEPILTCQEPEHSHEESCFETQTVLICALPTEPQEPVIHEHTEKCLEKVLTCGQEEHVHTELCLSDETADVEGPEEWAANAGNPETGNWALDLLGVASHQLGYTQSERNFILDENGERTYYTRYGDAYGDPYGSWNGMFLAYCLKYAGVPESVIPRRAGTASLLADMAGSERLLQPDGYAPQPGDIAAFEGRVGVIGETGDLLTVICGDVDGQVAEVSVAASAVSAFIRVAEEEDGQEAFTTLEEKCVDLKDYTTSVKLSYGNPNTDVFIDNDHQDPKIVLKDGDPVKIYINYAFGQGVRTDRASYDLPSSITTTQTVGEVKNDDGVIVGSFTIKNGKIDITYNENAWEGNTQHTGYVYFEGNASLNESENETEVVFPGAGKITIEKKEEDKEYGYNLAKSIVKAGEDGNQIFQMQDDGSVRVSYRVTLTATGKDGSGLDDLTIADILNREQWNTNGALKGWFDKDSFKLVKSGSEENLFESGKVSRPTPDNESENPTAEIKNLPPLTQKDESYTLTYDVIIPASEFTGNEAKSVKNWVKTDDNHNTQNTDARKDRKLQKSSGYNDSTGRITWTVTVNNTLGSVKNYQVWDELPADLQGKVYGDIEITDGNGRPIGTLKKGSQGFKDFFDPNVGYTFEDGSNPPYRFVYETTVPEFTDGQSEVTVTNTAKLIPEGEEQISVTQSQTVSNERWTVSKKRGTVEGDQVLWGIGAANTLGSKHFTVTDTIMKPRIVNGGEAKLGAHYAVQAELEKAFRGEYSENGAGLYVLLDDGNGNQEKVFWGTDREDVTFTVTYTTLPETEAVTGFTIDVVSTQKLVKGIYLSAYPTHVDFSQTPDGETWAFENNVKVDQSSSSDTFLFTKSSDFKKEYSTDNGNTWQQKGSVSLDRVQYGLFYRIVLTLEEGHTGKITVTDILPKGVKFINNDFGTIIDGEWKWWLNGSPKYDSETNELTFVIVPQDTQRHTVVIRYKVDIIDDPDWSNSLITEKNYHNVAKWEEQETEAEASTLVKRFNTTLSKEAQQIGTSNRIQYTVVINPNREDLADGKDSFTLEDTLRLENGITGRLLPGSFKLYYLSEKGGALDLSNSAPIIKLDWKAADPTHFAVTVPNQTALVLRYVFEIDMDSVPAGTVDINVNNSIGIGGKTSAYKKISIQDQKAGGGFNGDKFELLKIDADTGLLVSGAMFNIKAYEGTAWSDVWSGEISDGQIDFGITDTASSGTSEKTNLHPGVLYSIQETQAPENYQLDSEPRYVIFCADTNYTDVFREATGGGTSVLGPDGEEITAQSVTYLSSSGTNTLELENQYTHLDVEKVWRDQKNNQVDAPVDAIQVQLKRFKAGDIAHKEDVGEPVTLTKNTNWSYSWSSLSKDYYYTVEEVLPDDWKIWTVSYVNNGGIQTGKITITNVLSDEYTYELPKTGGTGTNAYVLLGLLATVMAIGGLIVNRKKFIGVNER